MVQLQHLLEGDGGDGVCCWCLWRNSWHSQRLGLLEQKRRCRANSGHYCFHRSFDYQELQIVCRCPHGSTDAGSLTCPARHHATSSTPAGALTVDPAPDVELSSLAVAAAADVASTACSHMFRFLLVLLPCRVRRKCGFPNPVDLSAQLVPPRYSRNRSYGMLSWIPEAQ